jgi:hypothetical protein
MTASITPAAIDALISVGNTAGIFMVDGPGVTDESLTECIFVGMNDLDGDGYADSATLDQSWAYLGHNMRDETVSVHCLASAWNGQGNLKSARDRVFANLTLLTNAIQSDATLGGIVLQVVAIRAASLKVNQDENGAIANLIFDIELRGRVS